MSHDRENVHLATLFAVLRDYTESAAQAEALHRWFESEKRENPERIALTMSGALYDGLAFGNWPWKDVQ